VAGATAEKATTSFPGNPEFWDVQEAVSMGTIPTTPIHISPSLPYSLLLLGHQLLSLRPVPISDLDAH